MVAPPPLVAKHASEPPGDRAIELCLAGDREGALRLAAAILAVEPTSPTAILLTGRLVGELGREDVAQDACALAAAQGIARGNFPFAVAAALEAARFGADARPLIEAAAAAFSKDSPRIRGGHAAAPPILSPSVPPLAGAPEGAKLLDHAISILGRAAALRPNERARLPWLPLLSSISREGLLEIGAASSALWVGAGTTVIEEGSAGAEAYFVARGELEVKKAGKDGSAQRGGRERPPHPRADEGGPITLARLGGGALFGEMALLARAPRAASVVASRPSIVVEVKREALDALADRQPEIGVELAAFCRARMLSNLERTSRVLLAVPPGDRGALTERFQTRVYEAGDPLIAEGDKPPGLYLIASGEVHVVRRDASGDKITLARLGPGDVAGEIALLLRRRAGADVVAACPAVTLFLPASDFLALVHDHPAMLAELYLLAVKRDEETASILEEEAANAEDFVLV